MYQCTYVCIGLCFTLMNVVDSTTKRYRQPSGNNVNIHGNEKHSIKKICFYYYLPISLNILIIIDL